MSDFDTIAAISTAISESGIGIVRVSGSSAVEIVNKIFFSVSDKQYLNTVKSHTINYGFIYSLDKHEKIDECLVSVMLAPRSFTGEDTVEVNCHGGVYVVKRILSEILKAGAKLAMPGEFSKRAFLNGRLDLSEAEAVMDVISSKSESSLKASINQLSGSISNKIKSIREEVLYEIAYIESALDDPEHISLDGYSERIDGYVSKWIDEVQKLILSNDNGRFLREGISTVLLGKPNAGKSSIMNLLLGEDRAIVTDIAGTTRDTLEEYVKIADIGLKITDTAGIRDTDNAVEAIGVDRAKKAAEVADLLLYVFDSSEEILEEDLDILDLYPDKKGIILLNKIDNEDRNEIISKNAIRLSQCHFDIIEFSAITGEGFEKLKDCISNLFFSGLSKSSDEVIITNERHRVCLEECLSSLMNVRNSIDAGMEEDFLSIDLMDAYAALGRIIGEAIDDDLATEIFSKFCLGK